MRSNYLLSLQLHKQIILWIGGFGVPVQTTRIESILMSTMKLHLYRHRFLPDYYNWHAHGEPYVFSSEPIDNGDISGGVKTNPTVCNPFRDVVLDAVGFDSTSNVDFGLDEQPNVGAQRFYEFLNASISLSCLDVKDLVLYNCTTFEY